MRAALPLAYEYAQSVEPYLEFYPRLCVVGPTLEELNDFASELATRIEEPKDAEYPNLHLPVEKTTDIRKSVEKQWIWGALRGGHAWINLIIVPPSANVGSKLPSFQRLIPKSLIGAAPGLLLAAVLDCGILHRGSIIVIPDDDLSADRSHAILRHFGECFLTHEAHSSADAWYHIRNATKDRTATEIIEDFHSKGLPSRDELKENWCRPSQGLYPFFVWCFDNVGNGMPAVTPTKLRLSIAGLVSQHHDMPHEAVHLRCVTPDLTHRIDGEASAMSHLLQVAVGNAQRSEDDCFVPASELMVSGNWSAYLPDRSLTGFSFFARIRGYPIRRLGEVCESIELVEPPAPGQGGSSCVWLVPAGDRSRESFLNPPENLSATRLYRLETCDPKFLWRVLNDSTVHVELACRSYGSYIRPLVAISTLRNLRIPWPAEKQRLALCRAVEEHQHLAWTLESASVYLADKIEEVKDALDDDSRPVAVWDVEGIWSSLSKPWQELDSILRETPGLERGGDEVPPAPIAILEQRGRNATEQIERLSLMATLAETVVRYDSAILLATMNVLNPESLKSVFAKLDLAKGRDFKAAFGHWRCLQREARKTLANLINIESRPEDSLLGFAEVIARLTDEQFEKNCDELVEIRNDLAHGGAPTSHECSKIIEDLQKRLTVMLRGLQYIFAHNLVYAESLCPERNGVTLRVKLLSHAPAEFERGAISSHRRDAFADLNMNEVCLEYTRPDYLISLYPWVHFATDENSGREAVWFLDKIIGDQIHYRSPHVPTGSFVLRDGVDTVRELIGI